MEKKMFEVKIDGQHVKLFDLNDGSLKQVISCHGHDAKSVEINGRWIFVLCNDEKVRIYDVDVDEPGIVSILSIVAGLAIFVALVEGFMLGKEDRSLALMVSLGGIFTGLLILGFSKIIGYLYESTQRLREIEFLLQESTKDKSCKEDSR